LVVHGITRNSHLREMAKILVVDDDAEPRVLLHALLVELGYEVLFAPNGDAALTVYDEAQPDLVITDLVMPEFNGVLLIEHLISLDPNARIIAMSGMGPDQLLWAQQAGAVAVLPKPICREQLVSEVERVLGLADVWDAEQNR
jgi:CheY-like chemotaxis protein